MQLFQQAQCPGKLMNRPEYLYADILIALAQSDDDVDTRERELLDGIFSKMKLDPQLIEEMWLTPRTMDVIESMLKNIKDVKFNRCLIKDCYLLAYADNQFKPIENKFIKQICSIINLEKSIQGEIHKWVKTALDQDRKQQELFSNV